MAEDRRLAADRIWIITGVPGAGKTTTARRLGERLPHSAVIHGDEVSTLVVGGYLRPEGEPADQAEMQLDLSVQNQALLARSFFDAGFTPIIDWIVTSADRLRQYEALLGHRPVHFVVLNPGEAVSVSRHLQRGKYVADRWVRMHDAFDRVRDLGLWIDNSVSDVDTVIDQLLESADKALIDFSRLTSLDAS